MKLSGEQFDQILTGLRCDEAAGASKEKRKRPRVGLRATVTVIEHTPAGPTRTPAMMRDISREGVGIQRTAAMKTGQRFLVQFGAENEREQTILCTVRRCNALNEKWFHIGATFVRVCPTDGAPEAVTEPRKTVGKDSDEARIRSAILA